MHQIRVNKIQKEKNRISLKLTSTGDIQTINYTDIFFH